LEVLKTISDGKRGTRFETIHLKKDGSRINVSITASPLQDDYIGMASPSRHTGTKVRAGLLFIASYMNRVSASGSHTMCVIPHFITSSRTF